MPYEPPPELAGLSLAQIAEAMAARRLPAVDQWNPASTGESNMRIAGNGQWFHEGAPITRPAMVRAFASLLIADETGQHWLATPHEKLAIAVDDAAFIATDLEVRADPQGRPVLAFRINTDEFVIAGPDHPIRAAGDPDTPALYLGIRHGTEARLNRSTYGQLIEHALKVSNGDLLVVESLGSRFVLAPSP
ncbi:DUF1285 domain-containing protein [Novosphingobium sp.]|uniref:DUF1285 domain-containing protein n=1 Tax=Novosphingobium sp. TaxID=1874826 RepID=UPI0025FAB9C6|nr:DUF1285 domain-containing protein [Novosphingobium sp.]